MNTSLKSLQKLFEAIGKLEWRRMRQATLTAVLTVLSSTGLMAFSSYIISFAALKPDVSEILVSVTAVRFFGIARAVLRYTERMLAHNTVFKLLSRLRVKIYSGVAHLPGRQLLTLDREKTFNTLTADIENLQDFYLRTFMPASISLMLGILATVFIAYWHPLQSLLFAALYAGAHIGAAWLVHIKTKGHSAAVVDQISDYRTLFSDYAEGIVEIQTCGRSHDYQTQLIAAIDGLEARGLKIALWRSVGAQVQQFLVHLTVFTALITGILWVQKGELPGVFLAATALCCFTLFESAPGVMTLFQKLESSGRSAEKVLQLMNPEKSTVHPPLDDLNPLSDSLRHAESASSATNTVPQRLNQTLVLENVHFAYQPNHPVLQNITLKISTGQRIAVVGASGSGKSTLMSLLTGLLSPDRGQLLVNDEPQTDLEDSHFDHLMSVVDQGVYLFNLSLRDNLLLGCPTATDEELMAVLEQAGLLNELLAASENATPSDLLNNSVGLSGRHLSGGQRQRVAIARALLRKAPFLMIDEPMAGLDATKEQEVLSNLFETCSHQGILWITHRLILMEKMDLIYVLHGGQVVEQGTHGELMALQGHYTTMMAVQNDLL